MNYFKFDFLILCPERNIGGLRSTIGSIQMNYAESGYICIAPSNANASELKEMKKVSTVHKGDDTITSLINTGMKKTKCDWNLIVFAGNWIQKGLDRKFNIWANDKKDILYPVFGKKRHFTETPINGILIHKDTFKEVGDGYVKCV